MTVEEIRNRYKNGIELTWEEMNKVIAECLEKGYTFSVNWYNADCSKANIEIWGINKDKRI